MSHYVVTVKDSEGGVLKTSGYMPLTDGTGRFQVTNLVTGTYTIDVSGYIQTGESSYSLIATGTETASVSAAVENNVVIEIDTFDDAYTGDITVGITMPVDVVVNNTVTGTLSWALAAIGNDALSFTGSETLSGTALEDGVYTLVVDNGNIPAGRYLLTVTLDNGTPYSSVEVVVAYPGLPSTGTLSLDSRKPADYSFTVTDMIGGKLSVNGEGEYVAETGSFVVTLEKGLSGTETAIWYVDGEETTVAGERNAYTITGLEGGRHIVVLVVYDTAQESAVGSLTIAVEVQGELTIEVPSHFLYTDNGDGTCTITGENPDNPLPSHDELTIPDEINGLKVTAIGKYASFYNSGFTGDLIIPDSVTTIGNQAFDSCTFTGTLTLGRNLRTIGFYAFSDNSFTGTLVIPDSVTAIDAGAFTSNPLAGIYCEPTELPTGWHWDSRRVYYDDIPCFWGVPRTDYDSIVAGTFDVAEPMISVSDDNQVTITSDTAFAHIYYTIDGSEPTAENGTLYEAPFTVEAGTTVKAVAYVGMETYSEVVEYLVEEPSHFRYTDNGDGTCTITGENPDNPLPSHDGLTIPEKIEGLTVTTIGDSAFYMCAFTGDLVIPDSVTTIGNRAFSGCNFTGTLTLPKNLQTIGYEAFHNFDGMFTGTLTLPKNLQNIGNSAFYKCAFTGDLVIPDGATKIGDYAFYQCSALTSIYIPDTVISIGNRALENRSFLTIYCETDNQPEDWDSLWNPDIRPVNWGVSYDEYLSLKGQK